MEFERRSVVEEHNWEVTETRFSTGENLVGKEVSAWIEDLKCKDCMAKSLRMINSEQVTVKSSSQTFEHN